MVETIMIVEHIVDELDIVFISYDEPMKEHHWLQVLEQNPFAKRVDGVVGFDAAHKQAAQIADTDRFITIDGDTTVNPEFFNMKIRYDDDLYAGHVFSWASTNAVNGLVYGNGSLKCWPRDVALNMKTHEHSPDERAKIDFCWTIPYLSMKDSYSTTHPAPTPYHAFRAGFREGVKMALDGGNTVQPDKIFSRIWKGNANRLLTWCSVGSDHENGLWCIYGARMGLHLVTNPTWDMNQIADYPWFRTFWDSIIEDMPAGRNSRVCPYTGTAWDPDWLMMRIGRLGDALQSSTGMFIPVFDPEQSRLHKMLFAYEAPETERVIFHEGATHV
jgi:hypothetical protein